MQVIIEKQFDGYPNGEDKAPVEFRPSETPVEVKDDFGQMIIAKGLARAASEAPKVEAPKE